MSSNNRKLVFSVSRSDLLFNFAASFDEVFRFSANSSDEMRNEQGVRQQEMSGYDFQSECEPSVEILPFSGLIEEVLEQDYSEFQVNVTLEDIGLGIRKPILCVNAAEIVDRKLHKIDLKGDSDFGFSRGFIVRCYISRSNSADPKSGVIWSKSQIVYEASFVVKASIDEALFEIAWTTFQDNEDRKHVLYFVDWISNQVSSSPHTECFQVKANNDLKTQFKRLENNAHFGELSVRMVADKIISDLAENTLRCAELELEPLEDSLHDKMRDLFRDLGLDFDALAKDYQTGDHIDQLRVVSQVNRSIQRGTKIASTLSSVKFGGYRKA
ncbi:hypothetical protein [Ruegeria arenilitoris]|uniref:hypothetical protein n=1 Tax=Ruegeria arenilitoris TaxID=1173585 RepID=UPI00147D3448|nr:hypothetical protein [Ruegeria arenilitoris]